MKGGKRENQKGNYKFFSFFEGRWSVGL